MTTSSYPYQIQGAGLRSFQVVLTFIKLIPIGTVPVVERFPIFEQVSNDFKLHELVMKASFTNYHPASVLDHARL